MCLLHVFVSSLSSSLPRCLTLGISDRPRDDDNEDGLSDGGCRYTALETSVAASEHKKKATPFREQP
jgi:hypothetical protein